MEIRIPARQHYQGQLSRLPPAAFANSRWQGAARPKKDNNLLFTRISVTKTLPLPNPAPSFHHLNYEPIYYTMGSWFISAKKQLPFF